MSANNSTTERPMELPAVLPRIGLIEIILKQGAHASREQAVCAMEGDALQPTVTLLEASAIDLVHRMLTVTE